MYKVSSHEEIVIDISINIEFADALSRLINTVLKRQIPDLTDMPEYELSQFASSLRGYL